MSYRLTKIYTRTGDKGTTNLGSGKRLAKDHIQIEALGTLDELNSVLGLLLAYAPQDHELSTHLQQIQQDLFNISGELCPPYYPVIAAEKTVALENMIDKWNASLPPLKEFILPGGNQKSACCHLARTICRRAERRLITLNRKKKLNPATLAYLNRLSDLLFVAARILMRENKSEEIFWQHERKK